MSERPWQTHALRWGPLAACAVVLLWHAQQFDFVTDDAYITFVYTRNFAEHGELSFNLGDPVEGNTNFLWTVLLAIPMWLGIPPEQSSKLFGVGFAIGTLVVVFRLTELLLRREHGERRPWAYLPPLLLALSSGFACWSSGGLETQLFTFLVSFAIERYVVALERPRLLSQVGVLLALAAMTRPEGLVVTAVLGVHRLAINVARDRRIVPNADELLCLVSFLMLWGPWFLWRWWYYGHVFPNTYYVKASGIPVLSIFQKMPRQPADYDARLLEAGLYYVEQWITQLRLLWAAPLLIAGLVVTRPRSPRFVWVTFAVPLAGVYLYYAISVGGDFMGLHRFIMPVFPIVAILAVLGLERLAALVPEAQRRFAAPAVAGLVVLGFAISQWRLTEASLHPPKGKLADHGIDTPGYLIAYTENRAAIGKAMAGCFRADDFSIVGGAGAQPYFARMRGIDVFGLVSERIAHEVPATVPRPGHNKRGPDFLLAEHDPDFVFHCYSIHSAPRRDPGCGYWKARGFEAVTIQVPGLDGKREGRDDTPGAGPVADRYSFMVKKERAFECAGLSR